MRVCTICGEEKSWKLFYGEAPQPGETKNGTCRECWVKVLQASRDEAIAKGMCSRCMCRPADRLPLKTCSDCATKRSRGQEVRAALREEVLDLYGRVCNCCGESLERFLTLDHVKNDGAEHRKKKSDYAVARDALAAYDPDRFQMLCFNCNFGKNVNGGVCPHLGLSTNVGEG